jgi:hypothetical protein
MLAELLAIMRASDASGADSTDAQVSDRSKHCVVSERGEQSMMC